MRDWPAGTRMTIWPESSADSGWMRERSLGLATLVVQERSANRVNAWIDADYFFFRKPAFNNNRGLRCDVVAGSTSESCLAE